ncbi:MAG TPA: ATP-binding protein [Vicinamibacterales bacterium]|nr:ATP-binding protein [Vicinamibacterales bacterium]
MNPLSSLRSRIFLSSAALAILCIGVALYLVNVQVTREAERTLEREIVATGAQIDQLRVERARTFTLMAHLIADLPTLKAAITTNDPPTVEEFAKGYQEQLNASLVVLTNRTGQLLYTAGGSPRAAAIAANQPAIRDALAGRDSLSLLPQPHGILQVVTVPVSIYVHRPEILGTLSVGFLLDDALLTEMKRITGSDLAFGMDGQILASTLPRELHAVLADHLRKPRSRVRLLDEDYEALSRPLGAATGRETATSGPVALILRSRTEQLQSLEAIHTGLAATAILAVLLGLALSFAVARTIARPLAAITDVMREVAATGDLTRKIALRQANRWDDEDARLLGTTFNTLTDSIARFQREMSQKERLTSLGRLSTVIAHEVRNPLMIIKAALHTLRDEEAPSSVVKEAITDIDEEVARLNRIVNDVLDFARPIHFELSPVDVNTLCRESATAAAVSAGGDDIRLDLDPSLRTITTDADRLRMALVNLLVNARHALNGHGGGVILTSRADGDRVHLVVADRGAGIAPADIAHIFDPYFTTKRGGTGLGLPIAKNIVEGLGGTISVSSAPGRGTEIQLDLPR